MSQSLALQLARFAESGNQQRLSLNNGTSLQGWIMEISDDYLLISCGYGEASGKDQWVNFTELNLDSLEYYAAGKGWQPFHLST